MGGLKMSEGYQFKIGNFVIGYCKNYTSYGIEMTKDGKIYQFWKFFIYKVYE